MLSERQRAFGPNTLLCWLQHHVHQSLSEPALWHRPQKIPDSKAILVLLHLYLPNLTLYFFCLKSILYKDILQLPLKCMETITFFVCVFCYISLIYFSKVKKRPKQKCAPKVSYLEENSRQH